MRNTRACAAILLGTALSGCIMLPPPPHPHPPPMAPASFAHHAPPPEAAEACAGQVEGSRFEMPGRRGEVLSGTCKRGADGRLVLRPDGR